MANDLDGGAADLQFDKFVPQGAATADALNCAYCNRPLGVEYYDVSGKSTCASCRGQIEALIETPRGSRPFLMALLFGAGAAIAGAILYYAVIAITKWEIGIVAIVIGYMVGYAVRKGAGGRGGRRFQVLAVVLTYLAVGLAYAPLVASALLDASLLKIILVAWFVVALPVIVVANGLPASLISAAIIFFSLQQAWRMTGAPRLRITGPYRVGAPPAPAA